MNEGDKILKLTSHQYSPLRYSVVSKVIVATLIKNNNWVISIGSYRSIANTATRQCRCTKLTFSEGYHCPGGVDAYWTSQMFEFALDCNWLTQHRRLPLHMSRGPLCRLSLYVLFLNLI